MSKDFRPIEMCMLSMETDPDYLFLNTVWNIHGKQYPLYDAKQKKIIMNYEYLGRCSPDVTLKLYDFFNKHNRLDVMDNIESDIKRYVENNDHNINSDIKKWLKGEHDKAFYYNDFNDEIFIEKMEDEYMQRITSVIDLKDLYVSLKSDNITSRSQLIDIINNNDTYKLFKLESCGKDEFKMTNGNKEYTFSWAKTYDVAYMIEDVVRAIQQLSDIEIEGVFNTLTLIVKLNEMLNEENLSILDKRISSIKSNKYNSVKEDNNKLEKYEQSR